MYVIIYHRQGSHSKKILGYATRDAAIAFARDKMLKPNTKFKPLDELRVSRLVEAEPEVLIEPPTQERPEHFAAVYAALPDTMEYPQILAVLARTFETDENTIADWVEDCE